MIAIIDIGLGNVRSVSTALTCLGAEHELTSCSKALETSSHLIFAGVGNYGAATHALKEHKLREVIRDLVLLQKKPILGICLGMQLLGRSSEEAPESAGLDLLPFTVKKINPGTSLLRIPHVGWNEVYPDGMTLFEDIPEGADFYFVHSYYCDISAEYKRAMCPYGNAFPAAVHHNNILGAQFHPEKSQTYGLKLLRNFISKQWISPC